MAYFNTKFYNDEDIQPVPLLSGLMRSHPAELFRQWVSQVALSMGNMEGIAIEQKAEVKEKFAFIMEKFEAVLDKAYSCCEAIDEAENEQAKRRATYLVPQIMWELGDLHSEALTMLRRRRLH